MSHANPYDAKWSGAEGGDPFSPTSEGKAATESNILALTAQLLSALNRRGNCAVELRIEMNRDAWDALMKESHRGVKQEPKEKHFRTLDGAVWFTQKQEE